MEINKINKSCMKGKHYHHHRPNTDKLIEREQEAGGVQGVWVSNLGITIW